MVDVLSDISCPSILHVYEYGAVPPETLELRFITEFTLPDGFIGNISGFKDLIL